MKVTFVIDGMAIQVEARIPEDSALSKEEMRRVVIRNAVNDIKNRFCIDVESRLKNVYDAALID